MTMTVCLSVCVSVCFNDKCAVEASGLKLNISYNYKENRSQSEKHFVFHSESTTNSTASSMINVRLHFCKAFEDSLTVGQTISQSGWGINQCNMREHASSVCIMNPDGQRVAHTTSILLKSQTLRVACSTSCCCCCCWRHVLLVEPAILWKSFAPQAAPPVICCLWVSASMPHANNIRIILLYHHFKASPKVHSMSGNNKSFNTHKSQCPLNFANACSIQHTAYTFNQQQQSQETGN